MYIYISVISAWNENNPLNVFRCEDYFVEIILDPFGKDDRMIYFINTIVIYRMTQTDPSNLPICFFFQAKINARGCFEKDSPLTLSPSLLPIPPFSLTAIYPAKSYFRWKFIALARIEASFPISGRTKQRELAGRDVVLRSKNNWRPLLSPSSLIRPA